MLTIDQIKFKLPMILGTALYSSIDVMCDVIEKSAVEMVTVALKRQSLNSQDNVFFERLQQLSCKLLPNTAGCHTAEDAILTAQLARELFNTRRIKLEVIFDDHSLAPNLTELVKAAEILNRQGFEVLPYCSEDLSVASALVKAGCRVLMPWAAPIGSGQGVQNPRGLRMLRQALPDCTLIVDAGLGTASDATRVMEMGFDGVLLNSAVALAHEPVAMAQAFALAVRSGVLAYTAGRMPRRDFASPSTSLLDTAYGRVVSPR